LKWLATAHESMWPLMKDWDSWEQWSTSGLSLCANRSCILRKIVYKISLAYWLTKAVRGYSHAVNDSLKLGTAHYNKSRRALWGVQDDCGLILNRWTLSSFFPPRPSRPRVPHTHPHLMYARGYSSANIAVRTWSWPDSCIVNSWNVMCESSITYTHFIVISFQYFIFLFNTRGPISRTRSKCISIFMNITIEK
jgi:hypothetical protein